MIVKVTRTHTNTAISARKNANFPGI